MRRHLWGNSWCRESSGMVAGRGWVRDTSGAHGRRPGAPCLVRCARPKEALACELCFPSSLQSPAAVDGPSGGQWAAMEPARNPSHFLRGPEPGKGGRSFAVEFCSAPRGSLCPTQLHCSGVHTAVCSSCIHTNRSLT